MTVRVGIDITDARTSWVAQQAGTHGAVTSGSFPSVVGALADGELVVGDAVASTPPGVLVQSAQGMVGALGTSEPMMLGGTPYGPEALVARLVSAALQQAGATADATPVVALVHDDGLDEFRTNLLTEAARLAGIPVAEVLLVSRSAAAEAAAGGDAALGAANLARAQRPDASSGANAALAAGAAAVAGGAGAAAVIAGLADSGAAAAAAPRAVGPMGTPLAPAGPAGTPLAPAGPAGTPLAPAGPAGTPLAPAGPAGTPLAPAGPAGTPLTGAGPTGTPLAPAGPVGTPLEPPVAAPATVPPVAPTPPVAPRTPKAPRVPKVPVIVGAVVAVVVAVVVVVVVAKGGSDTPKSSSSTTAQGVQSTDASGGSTAGTDTTLAGGTGGAIDVTPLLGTWRDHCDPFIAGDGASSQDIIVRSPGPGRLDVTIVGQDNTSIDCTDDGTPGIIIRAQITMQNIGTVAGTTAYLGSFDATPTCESTTAGACEIALPVVFDGPTVAFGIDADGGIVIGDPVLGADADGFPTSWLPSNAKKRN